MESSEGLSSVRGMGDPRIQLAKSIEKVSAKNLQVLSYMGEFYHDRHYGYCDS